MPSSSEPVFTPDTVAAVLAHMNSDHNDDNLLIVRAFAERDATHATMTTLDHRGATWTYAAAGMDRELTLPWTVEISDRPEIRREIVVLYERARSLLGLPARGH